MCVDHRFRKSSWSSQRGAGSLFKCVFDTEPGVLKPWRVHHAHLLDGASNKEHCFVGSRPSRTRLEALPCGDLEVACEGGCSVDAWPVQAPRCSPRVDTCSCTLSVLHCCLRRDSTQCVAISTLQRVHTMGYNAPPQSSYQALQSSKLVPRSQCRKRSCLSIF